VNGGQPRTSVKPNLGKILYSRRRNYEANFRSTRIMATQVLLAVIAITAGDRMALATLAFPPLSRAPIPTRTRVPIATRMCPCLVLLQTLLQTLLASLPAIAMLLVAMRLLLNPRLPMAAMPLTAGKATIRSAITIRCIKLPQQFLLRTFLLLPAV
jgi:hypothetical protein